MIKQCLRIFVVLVFFPWMLISLAPQSTVHALKNDALQDQALSFKFALTAWNTSFASTYRICSPLPIENSTKYQEEAQNPFFTFLTKRLNENPNCTLLGSGFFQVVYAQGPYVVKLPTLNSLIRKHQFWVNSLHHYYEHHQEATEHFKNKIFCLSHPLGKGIFLDDGTPVKAEEFFSQTSKPTLEDIKNAQKSSNPFQALRGALLVEERIHGESYQSLIQQYSPVARKNLALSIWEAVHCMNQSPFIIADMKFENVMHHNGIMVLIDKGYFFHQNSFPTQDRPILKLSHSTILFEHTMHCILQDLQNVSHLSNEPSLKTLTEDLRRWHEYIITLYITAVIIHLPETWSQERTFESQKKSYNDLYHKIFNRTKTLKAKIIAQLQKSSLSHYTNLFQASTIIPTPESSLAELLPKNLLTHLWDDIISRSHYA